MTGKDEWRLVHINGGVLTDSVITKNNSAKGPNSESSTPSGPAYISTLGFLDSGTGGNAAGGVTRALNRRPSESQQPGAPGDSNSPAGGSPGMEGNAGGLGAPGTSAGLPPGTISGMGGAPGLSGAPPGNQPPAQPACTVYIGGCPTTTASGPPPGQQPGQQFGQQFGQQPGQQPGFQPGNAMNGQGGMPPGIPGMPGSTPGAQGAQSAASAMISGLLTTPRPGGMPSTMPGATVGGGIAGVASKYEAEGIMVINERTAINEWEYIFDQTKYRAPPNPVSGTVGTPQQPMGMGAGSTGPTPTGPTPTGPNLQGFGCNTTALPTGSSGHQ